MKNKLQEKLKRLKNSSAWTFDEVLEFLTGTTSTQIEDLESRVHPPVPDIRYVLMLETRQKTWPAREEYEERHEFYTKGNVEPVRKSLAEHFIKNGWAKDSESSAERKNRIKKEENQYLQAQDQFTLLKMLKRAIQDRDIDSVNDIDTYPIEKWRLERGSVLSWFVTNRKTISPLRHFPNDTKDILNAMAQKRKVHSQNQLESKSQAPQNIDSWNQLTLCVLGSGQMEVTVAGETFGDDLLKEIMPGYLYRLLFHITAHAKPFDNISISKEVFKKEYIPRLRKVLQKGFKVNEDPIPYNKKAKGYEIKFKCNSNFPEESFVPQDATPAGVARRIKNVKRSIDEHF